MIISWLLLFQLFQEQIHLFYLLSLLLFSILKPLYLLVLSTQESFYCVLFHLQNFSLLFLSKLLLPDSHHFCLTLFLLVVFWLCESLKLPDEYNVIGLQQSLEVLGKVNLIASELLVKPKVAEFRREISYTSCLWIGLHKNFCLISGLIKFLTLCNLLKSPFVTECTSNCSYTSLMAAFDCSKFAFLICFVYMMFLFRWSIVIWSVFEIMSLTNIVLYLLLLLLLSKLLL